MDLKNVLIIGDSYSTFQGYVPEGHAVYYSEQEGNTDVRSVTETWWHLLLKETGGSLILNDSWSGSTIGYTGYNGTDCSENSSFLHRLDLRKKEGFFEQNQIDTVFLFGGTNDSWSDAPLGEMQYEGWEKKDLYFVLPALCCMVSRLKEVLPEANIVVLINSELKPEITEGLKSACNRFGASFVALEGIDKCCKHPTVKGMSQIKEQVSRALKEF